MFDMNNEISRMSQYSLYYALVTAVKQGNAMFAKSFWRILAEDSQDCVNFAELGVLHPIHPPRKLQTTAKTKVILAAGSKPYFPALIALKADRYR